ncbi:hypothetical protein MKX07_001539 [Trichoderma sp. CBMAI-0711]|nr:hypothetical protein MKX07_001539 [Trichoderma sp. CBMAI-0711]
MTKFDFSKRVYQYDTTEIQTSAQGHSTSWTTCFASGPRCHNRPGTKLNSSKRIYQHGVVLSPEPDKTGPIASCDHESLALQTPTTPQSTEYPALFKDEQAIRRFTALKEWLYCDPLNPKPLQTPATPQSTKYPKTPESPTTS